MHKIFQSKEELETVVMEHWACYIDLPVKPQTDDYRQEIGCDDIQKPVVINLEGSETKTGKVMTSVLRKLMMMISRCYLLVWIKKRSHVINVFSVICARYMFILYSILGNSSVLFLYSPFQYLFPNTLAVAAHI